MTGRLCAHNRTVVLHTSEDELVEVPVPDTPAMCFRCGEYHVLEGRCWEWMYRIVAQYLHLSDEELHNRIQLLIERRLLDRWARRQYL